MTITTTTPATVNNLENHTKHSHTISTNTQHQQQLEQQLQQQWQQWQQQPQKFAASSNQEPIASSHTMNNTIHNCSSSMIISNCISTISYHSRLSAGLNCVGQPGGSPACEATGQR